MDLLPRWAALLGEGAPAVRAGQDLIARYDEGHRVYHDRRHLAEVIRTVDLLGPTRPVLLAAYWHDAVYDPRREDNEERSALLATGVLGSLGVEPDTVGEVARLVRLTATHDPAPDDPAGAVLCDADLAILAAPGPRYRDYVCGVRAEYAHLPDAAFRAGRADILRRLRDHPRLYRTEEGHRRWEAPARANLAAELAGLTGCGSAAAPPP